MKYRVEFTAAAAKQLRKLDAGIRRRIESSLGKLRDNPRPAGVKKLSGADNSWRIRIGDYRVIYEIHDEVITVLVLRVAHRREVY
ncbi:type II toxin-antitoxin system RelE family toxin [Haematomicrobium sanguinis]|uniref:type II toxin-antitoxin system RelE family toxin n=1 Tax=Haematomicrobium sanguinis TaxID=479106 RepID=UPI000479CDBE|nr:type II toxin-antitoxin system RelE/ParE family toxin [Haematomicrobium sanguinis]